MGKGDQRSRKGKTFRGSYGKTRTRKSGKGPFIPAAPKVVEDEAVIAPEEPKKKSPKPKAAPKEKKTGDVVEDQAVVMPVAAEEPAAEDKPEKAKKSVRASKEKAEEPAPEQPAE
ncbi:MAG TPA: 30S ribosomal protein THX [Bacteroidales bacterium]|nr:30S ribosomal protein THX [Bacteroidales bacterium]